MKFGLFCLFEAFDKDAAAATRTQLETARYAEELGFDEIWLAEHHFNDFSVCPSPSLLLANLAAKTSKIRLGAAGFLAPFYDPIRLCEEIATLDILSQGRLNLGFAKGAFAPDCKHFDTATQDLRPKMIECASALNLLLRERNKPVSFEGKFIKFNEVDVQPKPVQTDMPTFIATFSSRETIEFAARNGFGLMLSQGASLEECEVASKIYADVAGQEPRIVLLRVFCVDSTNENAKNRAIPVVDHFIKSMRAASSFNKTPMFDKSKYEALIKERDAFFDGEKFMQNGIIGDVQTCIERIKEIGNRLKNVHLAFKLLGTSQMENENLMQKFMREIRPNLYDFT